MNSAFVIDNDALVTGLEKRLPNDLPGLNKDSFMPSTEELLSPLSWWFVV